MWAYAAGAPDAARLCRVGLARSHRYGLHPPRPSRLVRRIPAHTPIRIKPLGVARFLPTALVVILLAATAGAFALTERAKLERSPIYAPLITPTFSPDGKVKPVANIDFRIRPRERIDVWMEDTHGHKVIALATHRNVAPRAAVDLVWDGLTPAGIQVPDGVYHPVVKLIDSHRTIALPSDVRLDTRAPSIALKHPQYPIVSPDGDGHADVFRIPYTLSEPAHAILLLRGQQIEFTRTQKTTGELVWAGKKPKTGKSLPPGRYVLGVAAQDVAGNRSKGYPFAIVQIRYVTLARSRIVARAGGRFALRVSTDAPTVQWTLHGRSGTEPRGTLHFRAPRRRGVYHLYVTVRSHTAACTVVVA